MRTRLRTSPNHLPGRGNIAPLTTILASLTFAAQNCNSLNMSTNCPKQFKKINAITTLNCSVIFLSDIRLNNSECIPDIERIFLSGSNNSYKLYFNSTGNSRGVGILISTKLDYVINSTFKDEEENILLLNMTMGDYSFNLVSIYGPNRDDPNFFNALNAQIGRYNNSYSIIGGDWNCTYSTVNNNLNIDIVNMQAPPSLFRSLALSQLCETRQLSDPFRILHPDSREFTFTPRRIQDRNRSRLDFFLISHSLIDSLSSCEINPSLTTTLFDHKPIKLFFSCPAFNVNPSINRTILIHPRIDDVILAATMDTYIAHADPVQPHLDLDVGRYQVGRLNILIREINDLEYQLYLNGPDNLIDIQIAANIAEIRLLKSDFPPPEDLNLIALTCESDFFLEVLMGNIKDSIISFQSWQKKLQNLRKGQLCTRINNLRDNFIINADEILDLERELDLLVEGEIREKIKSMKLFEGLNSEKPTPFF